jgi:hypothetical protein
MGEAGRRANLVDRQVLNRLLDAPVDVLEGADGLTSVSFGDGESWAVIVRMSARRRGKKGEE